MQKNDIHFGRAHRHRRKVENLHVSHLIESDTTSPRLLNTVSSYEPSDLAFITSQFFSV